MKALEKGKSVAARLEISQLEAGISAAKTDLGNVEVLPSILKLYRSKSAFETAANATNSVTLQPLDPLAKSSWMFLTKAFGKTISGESDGTSADVLEWFGADRNLTTGVLISQTGSYWPITAQAPDGSVTLHGMEVLVFLLGGIPAYDTSANKVSFQGFSSARLNPCEVKPNSSLKRKGPYYEFDTARIGSRKLDTSGYFTNYIANDLMNDYKPKVYTYKNPYDGYYAYFASTDYKIYYFNTPLYFGSNSLYPFRNGTGLYPYINPKTFQIISQGKDQAFGAGGTYAAGAGDYTIGGVGYDDMANFATDILGKKDE
ncbi:MAG: hypothetical protein NTV50_13060 [Planctomycetota bacterium]|nr:hypothetical protein [Planctomycetota bacterium]